MKTKKLTLLALLSAIALTIFMVEAQIPPLLPIPGIKLGLANIVTVFTVFTLGAKEGIAVLFIRIFLGAVFAGNFSTIFYSAAGGALAIAVTILLRKILTKKQLWVAGCLGAIAHSIGQMAMAITLLATPSLILYLPVMIVISIITGRFTGLCAQFLVNRGKLWKTISKLILPSRRSTLSPILALPTWETASLRSCAGVTSARRAERMWESSTKTPSRW